MEIFEVKEEHKILRDGIQKLVDEFERSTGVVVADINISHIVTLSEAPVRTLVAVRIEIQ